MSKGTKQIRLGKVKSAMEHCQTYKELYKDISEGKVSPEIKEAYLDGFNKAMQMIWDEVNK